MDILELLLVPLFMLLDYFLTLVGKKLNTKVHARHFKTESYELNPNWQDDVRQLRWLNIRHLALVAITTGLIAAIKAVFQMLDADPALFDVVLGMVLVLFATIIGRHLNNIALFMIMNRNPDLIRGEVVYTQRLNLYLSAAQTFMVLVPFLVALILAPSPFLAGGVIGIALIPWMHLRWLRAMPKTPDESIDANDPV